MTVTSPFFPSTGQISNRGFIKRMEQWGWFAAKRKGDHWTMESPNGDRVVVCAPQISQGNAAHTFNEVIHIMGIDWQTFIDPLAMEHRLKQVEDAYRTAIQEAYDFAKKEIRADEDRKRMAKEREDRRKKGEHEKAVKAAHEAAQRAQQQADAEAQKVQQEAAQAAPEPKEKAPMPVSKRRITKDQYLKTAQTLGEFKAVDLAEAVGIDPKDKGDLQRVYSMLNYLTKKGLTKRTHAGHWAYVDPATKPEPKAGPEVEVEVPAKKVEHPPVGTQDAQDILDMLFPDGFKARHLPAIQTWMKATEDLIAEVQGGTSRL